MAELNRRSCPVWRRGMACSGGSCVEVASGAGEIRVRDSGDPTGAVLVFSGSAWRIFVVRAQRGTGGSHSS